MFVCIISNVRNNDILPELFKALAENDPAQ